MKRFRNTVLGGALTAILSFTIIGSFTVGNLATLGVVTAIPIATSAFACSKDQLVVSAQDVVDVVTNPAVMAALPPALQVKLRTAEPFARSLLASIKSGDFSTALAAVNTIFPIIDEIAAALHASPKILSFVGLANIGLHFIINHVRANVTSRVASAEVSTAIGYGAQPVWGCDYHKNDQRCR